MHTSTAMTIAVRDAARDLIDESAVIITHIEKTIGTYLSDAQRDELMASTDILAIEIRGVTGTDAEIREAHRVLTENAYAAQERIEVDAL